MNESKLLSIYEASKYLKVSEKTLRRWEQKGLLIPIRTSGGHRRYQATEILDFKKNKKRTERTLSSNLLNNQNQIKNTFTQNNFANLEYPQIDRTSLVKSSADKKHTSPLSTTSLLIYTKYFIILLSTSVLAILLIFTSSKTSLFAGIKSYLPQSIFAPQNESQIKLVSEKTQKELLDANVLAASSFQNLKFKVNVESEFEEDSSFLANVDISGNLNLSGNALTSSSDLLINPTGGGISVGLGSANDVDQAEGDLFVSDDIEAAGDIFAVNANLSGNVVVAGNVNVTGDIIGNSDAEITGEVSVGSLTIGAENFTDLTGDGLTNSGGILTTSLGTSIESSEIADSTIAEIDLNVSNSPTSAHVLTYNSSTGGFTWAPDAAGDVSLWTDGGSTTYLTATSDDVAIGGTTSSSPFFFDVPAGDFTLSGTLNVNGDTINSDGTTLVINAGGNVDIQDTLNVNTLTTDTGGITITSGQDLTIGSIGLNDTGTGPTNSGGALIGLFDEFSNSNASTLQDVLDDLDSAITGGSTGDITSVGDVLSGEAFSQTAGADGTTLYFEGATGDSNEIALTSADPGSDITVTIPDIAGTLASLAGTQTFTGAKTFDTVTFAPSSTNDITFNLDSDSVLILDPATANADNFVLSPNATGSNTFTGTLSTSDITADRTWTFPDVTGEVCTSNGNCSGTAGGSKWTDAGTLTYLTNTTDDLVIGDTAVTGAGEKISFQGDEDEIQFLIQGHSTQTSDLVVFENSSGTDQFNLTNTGNLTLTGDLTVSGGDIVSAATASLLNTTSTTINFAGAATTLNIADAAVTSTIDIGGVTADGASTINIATNATSSDTVAIGNSHASTTLALTGGDDWSLNSDGTFVLSASGTETTAITTTDTDYTNALSVGDNNITGAGYQVTSTSGGLTLNSTSADLALTTTTSGNITLTPSGATALVNILTGNLKVGNGSPGISLNGEDAYIEGTLELDSGLNITGISSGSGSALCVDGTNNVITCTAGTGGIAGSGTAGQIAFFTGGSGITSETSGFVWDSTNNKLGIGDDTPEGVVDIEGAAVGKALLQLNETGDQNIISASASGTTVFELSRSGQITLNRTTANADRISMIANNTGSATFTGTITTADLSADRTWTLPNATGDVCLTTGNCAGVGGTGDVIGPGSSTDNAVVRFDGTTGKTIQNSGVTISDADIVSGITQLNVDNLRLDGNTLSTTNAGGSLTLDASGGDAAGEDLIVTAHNIQIAATGAVTISPDASLTTAITATDTDLTNALSIGDNNITGTTFSLVGTNAGIDFSEFDVGAGTGSVTINDDGDTGNINIESTVLDINSLDFTGVGVITTGSGDLTLNPTDEVVFGDTDTLIIGGHAGNVAYNAISDSGGSPASGQIASDDDLYVEGVIEASGLYQGSSQVCDTSGNCVGTTNYWDINSSDVSPGNAANDDAEVIIGGNETTVFQFEVNGTQVGKALAVFNDTGTDQNIISASASGTTVANLDRSGNLSIEGYLEDLSGAVLNINDDLKITGNDIIDSGDTTRITLGAATTLTNTTTTLSGTTTLNGTSLTAINGGATAIDFTDFDVDTDGNITLAPDGASTALTINLPNAASRGILVDAAGNDNTLNSATQGVMQLSVDASISAASATNNGLYIDYEALDDSDASDTFNAASIALTSTTADADNLYALNILDFTAGSATETGIRLGAGLNNLFEIEGTTADGFQTFIRATAPTADRVFTLPDVSDGDFCLSSGNCAGGAGGSKWTDSGSATYLTNTSDDLIVGDSTVTGAGEKVSFQGDEDEVLLALQGHSTQTSNLLLIEQNGGADVLTLNNSGNLSTSDLTLGLNDTSATITTADTEDLTIDPASTGNIILTATTGLNITDDGVITDIDDASITITDDLAVNGQTSADITSTTTTATIFDSTVTTLAVGSAATTFNIGDGAIAGTIDIGGVTADGATTINLATNSTSSDAITIGNSNASTTLALTGGDDWNLSATGILTLSASATQTTAIDVTDSSYTNSISIADNNILGSTAAINFDFFDVSATGGITTGADGQDGTLTIYSEQGGTDFSTIFQPGTQTENVTYTLPNDNGTDNYVLTTDGSGVLAWEAVSGVGGVSGTGTAGQIAFFSGAGTITSETSGFGWDGTNNILSIAGTSSTATAGVIDVDLSSATDGFEGVNIDFQVDDDGGADTLIGQYLNIDNNATTADDTVHGIYLNLEDNGADDQDQTADSFLYLNNADTNDEVADGIFLDGRYVDGIQIGNSTDAITTAINIGSTGVTTDISLQNAETISNDTNGTIQLARADTGALTLSLSSDTSATISTTTGDLTLDAAGGNVLISDPINVGSGTAAAHNFFSTSLSGVTIANDDANDLFVQDEFEVEGSSRFDIDDGDSIIVDSSNRTASSLGALNVAVDSTNTNSSITGFALTFSNDADDAHTETLKGQYISIDDRNTSSSDTVYGLHIEQNTSATVDLDAALYINNADTAQAIGDALLIESSGGGAITRGINLNDIDIVTDLTLQNDETIDNNNDGVILFTATNTRASNMLEAYGTSIGLNNDDSANNVVSFGTGPGQATGNLYWGDDLVCDASATNCGWATSTNSPFTSSGGIIDKTTVADRLRLLYGDAADTQLTIENTTNNTIPTFDAAVIDLTGNTTGIVTDGVDGLSISLEAGNGTANTVSGARINFDTIAGSGDEIFVGLDIDALNSATSATEHAIRIGNTWDSNLFFNDTTTSIRIADTGVFTFADLAGNTLATLTDNSNAGDLVTTGDIQIQGGDLTTNQTTFNLINATATTLNVGSAATTFNLADAAITGTIDIGGVTADGGTTVNIATNSTTADTIAIGNSNSATLVSITGGDDWSISSAGVGLFDDGSASTPGIAFISDPDSGMYRIGTNNIGFAVGGVGELNLTSTNFSPVASEGNSLGSSSLEWEHLFLGDNAGINFGLDDDWTIAYDEATDDRLELTTSGTTGILLSSAIATGTGLLTTFDSVTTGTGVNISADGLTSGRALLVDSTSTSTTAITDAKLGYFNWSPGSATTTTGDLFRINIGSNGNVTNLFNVTDNGTSLFAVGESQITSAVPHQFTAAGDVAIAYDLVFTNQTASTIDSYGPLTLRAGESFENNNLTLSTYGTGAIIADGKFSINTQATLEDSTSPTVGGGSHFVEANGTNRLITTFDDGTAGQIIVIEATTSNMDFDCNGSATVNCGTTDITAAAGDTFVWMFDGTNWNLLSHMDDSNDHNAGSGFDLAEYYPSTQQLSAGEIVKVDPNNSEHVIRSASAYESQVVGVVSTEPGLVLGENTGAGYAIALAGRVPVKISQSSQAINPGDYITTSSEPGKATKATGNGRVIGQALESWSPNTDQSEIIVFINNTWYEPVQLADTGDVSGVKLAEDPNNPEHALLTDPEGNVVNKLSGLVSLIAENTKSVTINTKLLTTTSFNAFQGTIDNMLVKAGLISPEVLTREVRPLEGEKDIAIHIGNNDSSSGFGKLLIKNSQDQVVASVDEQGNASVSGQLAATEVATNDLSVTNNASIAGELRVNKIYADEIVSNTTLYPDSGMTREEIENMLQEFEDDQNSLADAQSWSDNPSASGSATLNELALENLFVTGQAAFKSLALTESLVIGNDLVIASVTTNNLHPTTTIDTLNAPLSLQSSGTQPLLLMAGKVAIDTSGNVQIQGDLSVGGAITANSLTLTPDVENLTGFGKLLSVTDSLGQEVAGISATGSATFASVETDKYSVRTDPNATSSATLAGNIFESNASAGNSKVIAGTSEIIIKNPNIKSGSLVFVTPTSSMATTLYIKEQVDGQIKVGFDLLTPTDVTFNWWIVGTTASNDN